MKFSFKAFIAIFSVAAITLLLAGFRAGEFFAAQAKRDFVQRYSGLSTEVADTLIQIDKTTDLIMKNALYLLREVEHEKGLPSNADLIKLGGDRDTQSYYVIDKNGKFIRSDWFITAQKDPDLRQIYAHKRPLAKSLFSFCEGYRGLLTGKSSVERTPIVPSGDRGVPFKYLMIPNYDHSRILETDMSMGSIGEILGRAMQPDPSIISIGLFTPSGDKLGYVRSAADKTHLISHLDQSEISFDRPVMSPTTITFFTKVKTTTEDCCECRIKGLASNDGVYFYVLRTEISRAPLIAKLAEIRNWFFRMGLLAILLSGIAAYFLSRGLVEKLIWIGDRVKQIAASNDLTMRLQLRGKDELSTLAGQFDNMMDELRESQTRLAAAEREKAFVALATQVAHDIRSPLAALDSIAGNVERLSEDRRGVVRDALGRIHDIADNLLDKYRVGANSSGESALGGGSNEDPEETLQALSELITPVITEKRFTYQSRPEVEINVAYDTTADGLLVRVAPAEFKRVLSNLIDNGVEALPGRGKVTVSFARDGDSIEVQVKDTGRGIPVEYRDEVGRRGRSFGKLGGSGLGLYHAKTCVERWGGRLEIESEIGEGTTIALCLPVASPSPPHPDAVLIDDDLLVQANWKVAARNNGKALETFSTPREFMLIVGRIDKNTPIYVDSKLADGLRGEEFAKELYEQGFRNLYLATGSPRESLPAMSWVKGVVGKKAPW